MSNSASKKQCTLKRKIKSLRKTMGDWSLATGLWTGNSPEIQEYRKADTAFWEGPIRYGNKRHAAAKEKVSTRRIQRKRNNRDINKQLRDEE